MVSSTKVTPNIFNSDPLHASNRWQANNAKFERRRRLDSGDIW
jgi:hypothetical protein